MREAAASNGVLTGAGRTAEVGERNVGEVAVGGRDNEATPSRES